jgi:hypothetical protein
MIANDKALIATIHSAVWPAHQIAIRTTDLAAFRPAFNSAIVAAFIATVGPANEIAIQPADLTTFPTTIKTSKFNEDCVHDLL